MGLNWASISPRFDPVDGAVAFVGDDAEAAEGEVPAFELVPACAVRGVDPLLASGFGAGGGVGLVGGKADSPHDRLSSDSAAGLIHSPNASGGIRNWPRCPVL